MQKVIEYRKALLEQSDQEKYLLANSSLPSPRANLELLYAFVEIADLKTVLNYLNKLYSSPPVNVPEEFVQCCAVSALGKFILAGDDSLISKLREYASDNRWRIRESVAMALQHIGKSSTSKLITTVKGWETGNYYEQRAVAAGLCEPANLQTEEIESFTLNTLKSMTEQLTNCTDAGNDSFKSLVKALCYCWSVAIVSSPERGKVFFEEIAGSSNKVVRKIVKENLKKNRLIKMDKVWVDEISQVVSL
jgi:hypothetical protein